MGSPKLTEAMVDQILTKLRERPSVTSGFLALGIPIRLYCVRDICEEVGISRTTFYRWLRAAAALRYKRGLTQREQLLRQLGRGIKKIVEKAASVKKQSPPKYNQSMLFGHVSKQRRAVPNTSDPVVKAPSDASKWESLTDELTSGIRSIDFEAIDSLKNM